MKYTILTTLLLVAGACAHPQNRPDPPQGNHAPPKGKTDAPKIWSQCMVYSGMNANGYCRELDAQGHPKYGKDQLCRKVSNAEARSPSQPPELWLIREMNY
ncbi:hypothetical protein E6O75_ATG06550 [Venturia nashicola]|uniref:Uncharacterized protein n=1 Tax=Venturia nashicola TaxID=86259 RepID=A0A4Z1P8L8_9PEZI|nr:hypothetical protein E6O75_ATG06550 [Venturia nashicola]